METSKRKCKTVDIEFETEEKYDQYIRVNFFFGGRAIGDMEIDGCEITRIHIRDAFRGRGFGRMALNKALAIANEHGCDEAILKSIPESVGFFKKHGFVEVGKEDTYTVMTRKL